jgi:hypothetical protein
VEAFDLQFDGYYRGDRDPYDMVVVLKLCPDGYWHRTGCPASPATRLTLSRRGLTILRELEQSPNESRPTWPLAHKEY